MFHHWEETPYFWERNELNRMLHVEVGRYPPQAIDLDLIDDWHQYGYGLLDPWANPVATSSVEFAGFNMWLLRRLLADAEAEARREVQLCLI